MCKLKNLFSFYLSWRWLIWVSSVSLVYVGFYVGAVRCWFPTSCTCYVYAHIARVCLCVVTNFTLISCAGLSRQGSSSRWYSLEISWIVNPSTPILDGLKFWESLKLMGKSLYFMGKSLELLKLWMGGTFEALMSFLWKICCWENLELVNLNANFYKNLSWEILLGISLPQWVGKFCVPCWEWFWKCSCGKICLEHWWNFWKF